MELSQRLWELTWGLVEHRLAAEVERVVVVGGEPFDKVPLAVLRDAAGRSLLERFELVEVPSLGVLSHLLERDGPAGTPAPSSVLAVGDPWPLSEPARFPPLPAARDEAVAVSQLYPERVLLLRDAARLDAVVAALAEAQVFHFAGHALAAAASPDRAMLYLATADGQRSSWTAAEVAKTHAPNLRLAVLAGCETGSVGAGPVHALATGFLVAGAEAVVATRWPLRDDEATLLLRRFHELVTAGERVPQALRRAQLESATPKGSRALHPAVWSSFHVVGWDGS
jgi:CHAT domain-containing protein